MTARLHQLSKSILNKLKLTSIMDSLAIKSDVIPVSKRIKLDTESDKTATNAWRSKLIRDFDESDVGITEFIADYKPFDAIIKNRYEDFLVYEISKSGKIVRLTDVTPPKDEMVPVLDIYEVLDVNTIDNIKQLLESINSDKNKNNGIDSSEIDLTDLDEKQLPISDCKSGNTTDEDPIELNDNEICNKSLDSVKILVTNLSKSERTRIHKSIKDNYEELDTNTVDEGSDKYIVVKKADKNANRKRNNWPKDKGEYMQFVLYKENKETQQAINEIALKLNISAKNFDIGGTKDKRAITTQEVTAWKVPALRIWSVAQRCRDIEVGHFRFTQNSLNLGIIWGNHFNIVLRDVKCSDRENAEKSLNNVKTFGAINYYGMQRFGHQYEKPYVIGIHILRQNWEQVVNELLSPKAVDKKHNNPKLPTFNECIDLWKKTKNAKLVYMKFPFKWTPEGTLLKGLSRVAPTDYMGAICTGMSRNQRLLYVHCYQSYIWNKTASYRIKTFGHQVVIGDLIQLDLPEGDTDSKHKNIVVVNEDNIKNATIYNIVIPIVGSDIVWPTNCIGKYIESLLAEDNISIDLFRNLPKQWLVCGSYRKLYVRPKDFDYQWITYKDPNIPLVTSDFDLIKGNKCEDKLTSSVTSDSEEKTALKISMSLPSSCYATMICRQITRTESTVMEWKDWLKTKHNL
ncbi:pseudouridylate synthase 7 homolog [Oppia nitens]|uniref:pseudouridylate synthase 7 homolog n=1 Tax=Oppia nitens TaxID=1686743 RepID=UPI0023DAFBC3|nr:pseudouridylate synthase 7 homolog [Oppia nitens]